LALNAGARADLDPLYSLSARLAMKNGMLCDTSRLIAMREIIQHLKL
jgi:hypothetical protein